MKIVLILSCALLSALYVSASDSRYKIGIEAGPNISTLRGSSPFKEMKFKPGLTAGVSFQYNFNPRLSLLATLSYQEKGGKAPPVIVILDSIGTSTGGVTPFLNYYYLTLPVLLQYTIGKKVKYHIAAGPYFSYLLARKDIIRGDNIDPMTLSKSRDLDQPIDLGGTIAIGISIPIRKNVTFSVDGRSDIGFYNTCKIGNDEIHTIKNRTIGLILGVQYNL